MTMRLPAQEWIKRVEQSEKDYMKDRMEAILDRPGNPEGVELARFGNALCLYSRTMPWPAFNTVKGFSNDELDALDDILDFYGSRQRNVQFEIVPSRVDQNTLQELSKRGLYQSGFHVSMYGEPTSEAVPFQSDVHIEVLSEEDFTAYATLHCRGTGLPDDGIPHVAENNRVLWRRPGWTFFIARVTGQPAATGVMYSNNGITSLTFSATLPEYRGRGLHAALLKTRMSEAARHDCDLVVGQCAFLSQSHRNMTRAGMNIAYVRTTWTQG